jgi:hypothetical protein
MLIGQLKGNKYIIGEDKFRNQYVECKSFVTGGVTTLEMTDVRDTAEWVKGNP